MMPRITGSAPPLLLDDIGAAQQRLGVQLPAAYAAFLLAHNGGKPTPAWFRHGADPADVAQVTTLFSLEEMQSETQSRRDHHPHLIAIGVSSDTNPLMLSTRPEDAGAVFCGFNDEEPDDVVRVADSLDQFLSGLDYPESARPWMMLIDSNDVEGLRHWLDSGGDVQAADDVVLGITALEHAASMGRLDIVKLLVSRGAKARGGLRRAVPHRYARQGGHRAVAAYLAEHGMAKGYWLHGVAIAVCGLVAVGLSFVPQPRELFDTTASRVIAFALFSALAAAIAVIGGWRGWWRQDRS